jgi:hypothetical protein
MAGDFGVTVNTTSTTVLASNGSRLEVRVANDGTTVIYLNFGAGAVVGGGIRLNPNGDFILSNTTSAINAISTAAGGRVTGSWA